MALACFLIGLNLLISWWNATVTGRTWDEVKKSGSVWQRIMLYCGWLQSALGFSWCYLFIIVTACLQLHVKHYTPRIGDVALELGYLVFVPGILLSGIFITIDSWADAIKTKRISSYAAATYNTAAMAYDVYGFAENAAPILSDLFSFFTKDKKTGDNDDDNDATMIVIVLVIIAAVGGFMTTHLIVGKARSAERRKHAGELEAARSEAFGDAQHGSQ